MFDGFHGVFDLEEAAFGGPDRHVGIIHISEHSELSLLYRFKKDDEMQQCVLLCMLCLGTVAVAVVFGGSGETTRS